MPLIDMGTHSLLRIEGIGGCPRPVLWSPRLAPGSSRLSVQNRHRHGVLRGGPGPARMWSAMMGLVPLRGRTAGRHLHDGRVVHRDALLPLSRADRLGAVGFALPAGALRLDRADVRENCHELVTLLELFSLEIIHASQDHLHGRRVEAVAALLGARGLALRDGHGRRALGGLVLGAELPDHEPAHPAAPLHLVVLDPDHGEPLGEALPHDTGALGTRDGAGGRLIPDLVLRGAAVSPVHRGGEDSIEIAIFPVPVDHDLGGASRVARVDDRVVTRLPGTDLADGVGPRVAPLNGVQCAPRAARRCERLSDPGGAVQVGRGRGGGRCDRGVGGSGRGRRGDPGVGRGGGRRRRGRDDVRRGRGLLSLLHRLQPSVHGPDGALHGVEILLRLLDAALHGPDVVLHPLDALGDVREDLAGILVERSRGRRRGLVVLAAADAEHAGGDHESESNVPEDHDGLLLPPVC